VIWAVSVVFPLADLLVYIFRKVGALDPAMKRLYSLRAEQQARLVQRAEAQALASSVGDIVLCMHTITRDKSLKAFIAHFRSRDDLHLAIIEVCLAMSALFLKAFGLQIAELRAIENDPSDDAMLRSVGHAIKKLELGALAGQAAQYFDREQAGPFVAEWDYLQKINERFTAYATAHEARAVDAPRTSAHL
jgi:hypothetical protein